MKSIYVIEYRWDNQPRWEAFNGACFSLKDAKKRIKGFREEEGPDGYWYRIRRATLDHVEHAIYP